MTDAPAVDDRDRLFIDAFLKSRDAVAACKVAGFKPREAAKVMARLEPVIAAAEAAGAPEPDRVSLASLIENARAAYSLAEREGNAASMVSATQLLAKLTGRADGEAPELEAPVAKGPASPLEISRAIFSALRPDGTALRAFVLTVRALEAGQLVVVQPPGKFICTVSDPDLARAMGGVLAQPLDHGQPIDEGDANG